MIFFKMDTTVSHFEPVLGGGGGGGFADWGAFSALTSDKGVDPLFCGSLAESLSLSNRNSGMLSVF
jgi:hypothetical protein